MSVQDFTSREYDYVICGGGTAGLVVATRLTEDSNVSVAVIEAGGNGLDDLLIDGPNLFLQLLGKPQYDWVYQTTPQASVVTIMPSESRLTTWLAWNSRPSSRMGERQGSGR
jgi:choline dehydrogenase